MAYEWYKDPNLEEGDNKKFIIEFNFESQEAEVWVTVLDDHTLYLNSVTDGYHWLHFFLSQQPHAKELKENMERDEERRIINGLFNPHGIKYEIEDKETAFLHLNEKFVRKKIEIIASLIEPRFANREKFFTDERVV